MKKIINNKVYDTDTARFIYHWDNDLPGDMNWCEEFLYQKKTGEYFIYGSGGAMSGWARSTGQNSWGAGEGIRPVTFEYARAWAKKNMPYGEYRKNFEVDDEEAGKVAIQIQLNSALRDRIKRIAAKRGVSVSQVIEEALITLEEE
jgi:hypothetical protein